MDPDQALKNLRELVASLDSEDDTALEIAHQFEVLDRWICNGGFLPKEWAEVC